MDESTLTDGDVTTEYGRAGTGSITAETTDTTDTDTTDADTTDADTDDTDQDADADADDASL
jgi:hypothetical protein